MNWPRLRRALAAREIRRLETLRIAQAQGVYKGKQLSPEDWEGIGRNEEILAKYEQRFQQSD